MSRRPEKMERTQLLTSNLEKRSRQGMHLCDAVVLWCENSPKHIELRNRFAQSTGDSESKQIDNHSTRFECHRELSWCLRSLAWCTPWLRRIYVVVADHQFPEQFVSAKFWQDPKGVYPEVMVVPHSAILPKQALPTFNSQAIEACIHRLPGLQDRFIYLNDDFCVGCPLPQSFFFDQDEKGMPVYHLDRSAVPDRRKSNSMSMHARAWCNNSRMLDVLFGPPSQGNRRYPSHVAVPMLRSSFDELWANEQAFLPLQRTACSQFRRGNNLYIIGLLVYWNIYAHTATSRDGTRACFFHDCAPGDDLNSLGEFLLSETPPLICVNDAGFGRRETRILAKWMRRLYPLRAPWEPKVRSH
jgi:hypothetical protein